MLLGADIYIYTDHRNLTYNTLSTQRVLRWRLFIEEFYPTFHYIKGEDNVVADALSRLPIKPLVEVDRIQPDVDPDYNAEVLSIELDNESLLECFLHHPHLPDEIAFPLDYPLLRSRQLQDSTLLQQQSNNPDKYPTVHLDGTELICYVTTKNESWCIVIPNTLLDSIISWYHQILSHIGMTRLYDTISVHFYHSCLKSKIEAFIQSCNICQCAKLPGIGYGHLPPQDALIAPWFEVAIDLIRPWQVTIGSQVFSFQALTCIDTVTNLAEIIHINNKSSKHISMLFENNWLA